MEFSYLENLVNDRTEIQVQKTIGLVKHQVLEIPQGETLGVFKMIK